MKITKSFLVILLALTLTACGGGVGLILGIISAGAVVGLTNQSDDDNGDSTTSNTTITDDTTPQQSYDYSVKTYDGSTDDLVTAGLGQQGLMSTLPAAVDSVNPSATELRQIAIAQAYQASQDRRSNFGFGSLYGPAAPTRFVVPSTHGKVAGKEYLAYADNGSGQQNVTMMVQIPSRFTLSEACIIAVPTPGFESVYAGIPNGGEWGLKTHCTVAYTDKGAGNGIHDLQRDSINLIDGTLDTASNAGKKSHFTAQGSAQMDLAAYYSTYPNRLAQKFAHSQQNPEDTWEKDVLDSIKFAFYVLNLDENYGNITTLSTSNTIVIAAGVSTGGSAVLRAAEQDQQSLIDGIVVISPVITSDLSNASFSIQQNTRVFSKTVYNKPFFDVLSYQNLYQACASANTAFGLEGRCYALRNANWLVNNVNLTDLIANAQEQLNNYGILNTANALAHYYEANSLYAGITYGYASAYGKFSLVKNLCDYSYAYTVGNSVPQTKPISDLADDFATSWGLPPSSSTYLINNQGNNGNGINYRENTDNFGNQEGYLAGAFCLRDLATATANSTLIDSTDVNQVQVGLNKIKASGNLKNKPTILVHGRNDALAHINFTSRAYYGLNQQTRNTADSLTYIEVTDAHHFDSMNQQYQLNQTPLQYYLTQALDIMYDHLKNGISLPSSQVIRTTPSNGASNGFPRITQDIESSASHCPITFSDNTLAIPKC